MAGDSVFYTRVLPAMILLLWAIPALIILLALVHLGRPLDLYLIMPILTTAVMVCSAASVYSRWLARGKTHFLFWSIGLAMFGVASSAEAYFDSAGWSPLVFFLWYFFGVVLTAAWIGHGTLLLLFHGRWTTVLTGILIAGSLAALVLMLQVMPKLDADAFDKYAPILLRYEAQVGGSSPDSDRYAEVEYRGETVEVIRGVLPLGAPIRSITPFFNIYGMITLVGGALWSAWLFLRNLVLPNRVMGTLLVAFGGIAIGSASTRTWLHYFVEFNLGELVAAVLMYSGFVLAARPATQEEAIASPA